eukprot:2999060-Karenia_brevis.AAC.1
MEQKVSRMHSTQMPLIQQIQVNRGQDMNRTHRIMTHSQQPSHRPKIPQRTMNGSMMKLKHEAKPRKGKAKKTFPEIRDQNKVQEGWEQQRSEEAVWN